MLHICLFIIHVSRPVTMQTLILRILSWSALDVYSGIVSLIFQMCFYLLIVCAV